MQFGLGPSPRAGSSRRCIRVCGRAYEKGRRLAQARGLQVRLIYSISFTPFAGDCRARGVASSERQQGRRQQEHKTQHANHPIASLDRDQKGPSKASFDRSTLERPSRSPNYSLSMSVALRPPQMPHSDGRYDLTLMIIMRIKYGKFGVQNSGVARVQRTLTSNLPSESGSSSHSPIIQYLPPFSSAHGKGNS